MKRNPLNTQSMTVSVGWAINYNQIKYCGNVRQLYYYFNYST